MTICKIEQQACHTVFPLHLRYINQSRNALFLIQEHFEEAIDLYYMMLIFCTTSFAILHIAINQS